MTRLATCDSCRLVVDETSRVRAAARSYGKLRMPEHVRERIRGNLAAMEEDGLST